MWRVGQGEFEKNRVFPGRFRWIFAVPRFRLQEILSPLSPRGRIPRFPASEPALFFWPSGVDVVVGHPWIGSDPFYPDWVTDVTRSPILLLQ